MSISKIESDYDNNNQQYVLIFYLINSYEAEKAQVNLLPGLRIRIGFTIDVLQDENAVIVKYANEEDKEKILHYVQMILAWKYMEGIVRRWTIVKYYQFR